MLARHRVPQCSRYKRVSKFTQNRLIVKSNLDLTWDLDLNRVGKPDSPDRDARYGHFPNKKLEPGYKQHTVADGHSRVIVGMSVTPANSSEHDSAVEVIDEAMKSLKTIPEVVCADAAYGSGENCQKMMDRGIRLVSPPPKARTYTGESISRRRILFMMMAEMFLFVLRDRP